ncbi:hypothetical protein N7447_002730 [Penicillium robsamsonii]|uniref:uncharacterized protein n=1 Tax=Penicillium robsamsonii TaxID=1792511 RepID=UPI0025474575|nr:uncharacterized protein N7447_002730 [Penicillium robsamsonii]KAJ5836704.1 hypothetical protein N7447_002730 [Penicillium robsamsonii]
MGQPVAKHPETGEPYFARTTRTSFPRETLYGRLQSQILLALIGKLDTWRPRLLAAYQSIEGYDISPQFLGHLTEDGRVIGS